MPTYQYNAIDQTGRPHNGSLEAENHEGVRTRLAEQRLYIVNITEVKPSTGISEVFKGWAKAKSKDVVVFSRQFATMIDAGLSVLRCLDILQRQTKDPVLREALAGVRQDVNGGSSLTDAMNKHPRVFTKLYVNMVRSAEAGGILDQVLDRLATFLENDMDMKNKVKSAMMYPMIVMIFASIVMGVMMWYVLPMFAQIFKDMGIQKLPLSTEIMLGIATGTRQYWWMVIMVVVGTIAAFKYYKSTPTGALQIDTIILKLPVMGEIVTKLSIARFTRTFGTLIASGVPVLRALEITTDTAGNLAVAQVIEQSKISVRDGEKISDPMQSSPLFPVMVTQMVAIGEETGRLDQMLSKIADFYDAEVDNMLKGLASLVEPIMIVGLGIMVGFIAISVITPIYSLISAAQ